MLGSWCYVSSRCDFRHPLPERPGLVRETGAAIDIFSTIFPSGIPEGLMMVLQQY